MFDICGYGLCQPIAVSYLVFAPVVDLAEALHPGGVSLPYVSRINGDDHVVEDVPASQPAYLTVDFLGEIPVVKVSRQPILRLYERDRFIERAGNAGELYVFARLNSVYHLANQSLLRFRQALGNDS